MKVRLIGALIIFAPTLWAQLAITTTSLPDGTIGTAYSAGIGTNSNALLAWGVSGSLPPGLVLATFAGSSASIGGVPTGLGTFSFTITASGPGGQASASLSITIVSPPALALSSVSPLPAAMTGLSYTYQFSASGGSGPYLFSATNLPPGFQLASYGVLSGTPAKANTYSINVTVSDAKQAMVSATFSLMVTPALVLTTASPLAPGIDGTPYSQTIAAAGGTAPYSFFITGPSPPGLGISKSGLLAGTPSSIGTFNFAIRVADTLGFSVSQQYAITISPAAPLLLVSPLSLVFNGVPGGNTPPPQSIAIVSATAGAGSFAAAIDAGTPGSAQPAWISLAPGSGATPARLVVSVNPAMLQNGGGNAVIHITVPLNATQASIDVSVKLNVAGRAPQLQTAPAALRFGASIGSPGAQQQALVITNNGSGVQSFTATTAGSSPWLTATPRSETAGNDATGLILVQTNSQGLAIGDYHDIVRITGAESVDVPISLFVEDSGPILSLATTGARFEVRQGNGSTRTQSISVLNAGDADSKVNWTADLLSGSNWLSISTPTGTATRGNPGKLTITPTSSVASLAAGPQYALVRVSDPNSLNSPQYFAAVLDNEPAAAPARPDPVPAGLYFALATGPQQVSLYTSSSVPAAFQISTSTDDGLPWLSATPSSGTASSANPGQLTVSVVWPGSAGIHTGSVNIAMSGVLVAVNVTLMIPQSGLTPFCTPSKVVVTSTGLAENFSVPTGWATNLTVALNDDCGNAISNGSVVASFSNGDAPMCLRGDQATNAYSAAWQPGVTLQETAITFTATAGALLPATRILTGHVTANINSPPALLDGGALSIFFDGNTAASLGSGLGPGSVAQVYGSNLGPTSVFGASDVPLPSELDGTFLLVGGIKAPLYFVLNSPIAVQIPFELNPNQQYAAIASVNGALSLPISIPVVPYQPGISLNADGTVNAQHSDYSPVTAASPAQPDETIILYLTGMGATNPSVLSGWPTPAQSPAAVQPKVTVDSQDAHIVYAGLTVTGIGLYQINFKVPAGASSGNVNLVISQNGVASNSGRLPVSR